MTDRHESPAHLLVMLVVAFCCLSCGAPADEPEAAVPEEAAALADTDTDADEDQDEPRGLRLNTPDASPGYVFFNPNLSLTTYLVDVEGRVVHSWQSDQGPRRRRLPVGQRPPLARRTRAGRPGV